MIKELQDQLDANKTKLSQALDEYNSLNHNHNNINKHMDEYNDIITSMQQELNDLATHNNQLIEEVKEMDKLKKNIELKSKIIENNEKE